MVLITAVHGASCTWELMRIRWKSRNNRTGDTTMLPELLSQIPETEERVTVITDEAYDSRLCHAAITKHGATAIIPPRRNGQFWKGKSLDNQARNESLRSVRYLGQTLWQKWRGYHRRSLVEAKMHCFKLLADRVISRDFDRQIAELQVYVAILNRRWMTSALYKPLMVSASALS